MEIDKKRHEQLLDAEMRLTALKNAGVDNWDGYDLSLDEYFKSKNKILARPFVEKIGEVIVDNVDEPAGRGTGFSITENGFEEIEDILCDFVKKIEGD